eukprot:TRINITY_DN1881_c0_g3_i10.p1 TRINITY_DN1881_c0_g3~~TRINITY_DN1881_c0_g3_i10.p1  ORF type:complete len:191 (+),score=36.30 TRINITY_DN1881_c0_g3_i10:384-956(+)
MREFNGVQNVKTVTPYYNFVPDSIVGKEQENEGAKNSGDDFKASSGSNDDSSLCQNAVKINVNAYRRRNVYKAIIRRMFSCVQKSRKAIAGLLQANGFPTEEIESAFAYVNELNELDKQKGKSKRPQSTINGMLERKTILTFVLKETLDSMMQGWQSGHTGKIMKENVQIYKEVCEKYYRRCVELLAQPA